MGGNHGDEHIVMLPFMAHGHLIPFLALAKQIHLRTGFTLTIANTPLNIQYLRSTISNSNGPESKIRLVELPFCSTDHGLPPNTENTENLPLDQMPILFGSSKGLETPFYNLLMAIKEDEGKPPLCVIADVFVGWAADVAKLAGTVSVAFSTGGAYGTLAYISLWLNLPHRETDSEEFNLPGFPDRCRFHITQLHRFLRAADGTDYWSRFMQPTISKSLKSSYGMLCYTVEEIEPQALEWLRNYIKLPVWATGPLLPQAFLKQQSADDTSGSCIYKQHSGKRPGISPEKIIEWLDLHDPGSVLYISFGSQNTISPSQMMELAAGLEESAKSFIWVIRPPIGFDLRGEFRTDIWLPQGFEERMAKSKQGLLVRNWAPQLEILSHKSTGAFLSHCGWNSVMECLSQGVPIIGWPMAAEQGYNSKMLVEEMGVSVELARGSQSTISPNEVRKVIELVMNNTGKGREMKEKAAKIGRQIRASVIEEGEEQGSSVKGLENLFRSIVLKLQEQSLSSNE